MSGTVTLDITDIECRYFGVLPPDTLEVEVEPEDESWGDGFTSSVDASMEKVIEIVRREAGAGVEV